MILKMMPGGDTIDYDALTATTADVPEGLTFIGDGSEEEQTGTLENRENMHGAPGYSSSNPNVPIHQSVRVATTTDTNGDTQIAVVPPRGKYPGNTNAYVGIYPAEVGIEAEKIANGETVGGITGSFGADATAAGTDVRDGKVYYDKNGRQIGSAGDYAAAAATLKCGEVHNIQKGFHQAGKVTAASLSSQTQPKSGDAAAAAAQILEGYGAWSNGAYRDGSMPDKGNVAASNCTVDTASEQLRYVVPETGRYTAGNYLSRTFAQIRTALGIVASVIKNGTTIAGLKGTYGGDATAAAGDIRKSKTAYGKDGKITGTLAEKAAATFYAKTSDQTIAKDTILNGVQTFKKITQSNISAANIRKGVRIAVNNGDSDIFAATGTWYGNKKCINAMAYRGFALNSSDYEPSESASFTMPEAGTVYYGGVAIRYNGSGNGLCRIKKNGTVVDNRDLTGTNYIARTTMVDKSFAAAAGDVITVECTAESGTATLTMIQAVIVY